MKHRMFGRELQRFSIRKYSFGAASVLIGCILFMTGRSAFADSLAANPVEIANQSLDSTKGEEAANQLTVVQAVTEQKEEVVATEKEKSESSVSTSDLPMQAENPSTMSEGAADTSTPSARSETEAARAADEKESGPVAVDTTVRMAAAAGTTSSEEQQIPKQTLPSQGQYTYTKRTEVKNEPKATAPTQFYVNAGDKVFYDRVLTTYGYQWISYKSYSGIRRYAAIEKLSQAEPQNPIIDTPQGTLTITNVDSNAGSFDVHVTNISAPKPIKKVALPTWSSVNGQDDIIWYDAKKQVDGTYKISVAARDHKYSTGEYNIHLYYLLADNQLVGVGGTQTTVTIGKPQGKLDITNNNPDTGSFDVVVSEVSNPYGVKEVKLPTWSNDKGQDDLVWYTATKQADGTYKASIQARNHKLSTGEYHVHLYYVQDNGQLIGVGGTTTTVSIAKPKGTLTIKNNNPATGTFDILVSGVSSPEGVREVLLPTWSSAKGQDDLIWYRGVRQADGVYKLTVKASDHKYSTGEYNVHLYYVGDNGKLIGVGGTKTTVSLAAPKGKLTIQNNNQQTGTFEVVVSEVENGYGIKEVKLPTWSSAKGQDDLIWYTAAKQADGTYKAQVNLRDHKYSTGEYNIHLYYVQDDGRMVGVGGTKTTANIDAAFIKKVRYNGSYDYVQGKYNEIVIANKKHPLASNYNPGENPTAKAAFLRLRNDMIAQGYNVGYAYSGFRSYDYQKVLYQNYVNKDGQAAADRYSARPGYSEHQTGLVFDLTDKAGNLLEDAAASNWLKNNAHRYGFVVRYQPGKEASTGYMPEAWHIRYIGKEADEVYHSGLSLEEYYGFEGGDYASSVTPSKPTTPSPQTPSIPAQGVYRFTKRSSIKAEARMSAPELAYYDAGQSVTYDKVLNADGATWISYIAFSGKRRYIAVA